MTTSFNYTSIEEYAQKIRTTFNGVIEIILPNDYEIRKKIKVGAYYSQGCVQDIKRIKNKEEKDKLIKETISFEIPFFYSNTFNDLSRCLAILNGLYIIPG